MMTHLQETWKIQNKVTYGSSICCNYFKIDKLRFLVGISISDNFQKLENEYTEN